MQTHLRNCNIRERTSPTEVRSRMMKSGQPLSPYVGRLTATTAEAAVTGLIASYLLWHALFEQLSIPMLLDIICPCHLGMRRGAITYSCALLPLPKERNVSTLIASTIANIVSHLQTESTAAEEFCATDWTVSACDPHGSVQNCQQDISLLCLNAGRK